LLIFIVFSADTKKDLELYVEELSIKTEESSAQKEEITNLLAQLVDLQRKVKVVGKSKNLLDKCYKKLMGKH
jgi:hypothetical protein